MILKTRDLSERLPKVFFLQTDSLSLFFHYPSGFSAFVSCCSL
ncbi:hypothetical protein STRDD11_01410 [Streptococcus sp. DD11]|nr:hypothetical protein STRDD11_01410 [Streptococcus sp. DD11]